MPVLPACLSVKPVSPEWVPAPVQPKLTRTQLLELSVVKLIDGAVLVPVLMLKAPKTTAPEYSTALIARLPDADIVTVMVLLVLVAAVAV